MTDQELNDICKILAEKDPYLKDVLLQHLDDKEEQIKELDRHVEAVYEIYADI